MTSLTEEKLTVLSIGVGLERLLLASQGCKRSAETARKLQVDIAYVRDKQRALERDSAIDTQ